MDSETILLLVRRAKDGDDHAFQRLLDLCMPSIKNAYRTWFLPGGETADLMQVARLAIWDAVKKFQPDRGVSFQNYATKWVTKNHAVTAVKTASSRSQSPLNESTSLSIPVGDDLDLSDMIVGDKGDCDPRLIHCEAIKALRLRLSPLEAAVLDAYLLDLTYTDMAARLGIPEKCVDNCMIRVRAKAKKLSEEDGPF